MVTFLVLCNYGKTRMKTQPCVSCLLNIRWCCFYARPVLHRWNLQPQLQSGYCVLELGNNSQPSFFVITQLTNWLLDLDNLATITGHIRTLKVSILIFYFAEIVLKFLHVRLQCQTCQLCVLTEKLECGHICLAVVFRAMSSNSATINRVFPN